MSKLQTALHKERQAIAVLRAEWQLLTRPDRLQAAVDKHLALEPIGTGHLGAPLGPARPAGARRRDRPPARRHRDAQGQGAIEPRTTGSITRTVTTTRTPTRASR